MIIKLIISSIKYILYCHIQNTIIHYTNCDEFLIFQEMNESIGTTDMTSLPNHIDIKTESNSNTESVPNGTLKVKPASPKKTSKANNNVVVVKEEEPSNDVSNVSMKRPSTTEIGNDTSKKYMQTISNLMVQSSTTSSTSIPSNGVTNTNVAIPSPVSSTSSLSSISIPSRLGSSTPPISGVSIPPSTTTSVTNNNSNSSANSQPIQIKPPLSSSSSVANEIINSQPTNPAASVVPLPNAMLTSPSPLSLPPNMNGPLMGLSLNPLTSPSYRPLYSPYGLYPPYGLHHPYQTIPNPALSPRSLAEQRRDPSLTLAKPLKPHSPNSASPQQQAPNLTGAMGSTTATANHHQESPSRNHSPMREKER
jgi:hypothetical protein